jgi:hypothetical protein
VQGYALRNAAISVGIERLKNQYIQHVARVEILRGSKKRSVRPLTRFLLLLQLLPRRLHTLTAALSLKNLGAAVAAAATNLSAGRGCSVRKLAGQIPGHLIPPPL